MYLPKRIATAKDKSDLMFDGSVFFSRLKQEYLWLMSGEPLYWYWRVNGRRDWHDGEPGSINEISEAISPAVMQHSLFLNWVQERFETVLLKTDVIDDEIQQLLTNCGAPTLVERVGDYYGPAFYVSTSDAGGEDPIIQPFDRWKVKSGGSWAIIDGAIYCFNDPRHASFARMALTSCSVVKSGRDE